MVFCSFISDFASKVEGGEQILYSPFSLEKINFNSLPVKKKKKILWADQGVKCLTSGRHQEQWYVAGRHWVRASVFFKDPRCCRNFNKTERKLRSAPTHWRQRCHKPKLNGYVSAKGMFFYSAMWADPFNIPSLRGHFQVYNHWNRQ